MGVDAAIDITTEERQTVLAFLQRHLPGTAAWVYGSRVKWTSRPQSDLDLVVFATPQQRSQVGDLREAFEESNLPFRVDLFVWDDVPETFRERIEAEHAVLVEGRCRVLLRSCQDGKGPRPSEPPASRNYDETDHETRRFGDLFSDPPRNGLTRPKAVRGSGTKMVNMGELFAHARLDNVPMDRVPLGQSEAGRFLLKKGDLLFARQSLVLKGAGKCSLFLGDDEPVTFESHVTRVRLDQEIASPSYYFYYLQSHHGRSAIRAIVEQGAGASGIRGRDLVALDFLWRPLPEQRAIAHILGTLDDKIELNRRMNATLEAMARALFRSWFVDFDPVRAKMERRDTGLPKDIADLFPDRLVDSKLGEIPLGWRVRTLGHVAMLNPESWSNRNAPDSILYVDLASVKWGCIDEVQSYAWDSAPSRGRRVLRQGDTIVGTVRPGNGSFAFVDRDGLTGSTAFAVLRPRDSVDRAIVWCAASSRVTIDRLAHTADGGAYPAVSPRAVLDTRVVLPESGARPAFASIAGSLLNRIHENRREARMLASMRDTLLPKLVSGEIRVRDAEKLVGAVA